MPINGLPSARMATFIKRVSFLNKSSALPNVSSLAWRGQRRYDAKPDLSAVQPPYRSPLMAGTLSAPPPFDVPNLCRAAPAQQSRTIHIPQPFYRREPYQVVRIAPAQPVLPIRQYKAAGPDFANWPEANSDELAILPVVAANFALGSANHSATGTSALHLPAWLDAVEPSLSQIIQSLYQFFVQNNPPHRFFIDRHLVLRRVRPHLGRRQTRQQ